MRFALNEATGFKISHSTAIYANKERVVSLTNLLSIGL